MHGLQAGLDRTVIAAGSVPIKWRCRGIAAALVIPLLLRTVSYARIMNWLTGGGTRREHRLDDLALALWVNRVLEKLPSLWRATCLSRATVLYHLLRRAGRPVELYLGVARSASGSMTAHAWLVRSGQPYLEPDPDQPGRFKVISRFPEGRGA